MLLILLAAALHAETVTITVSASRQSAVSEMQAMRRMKLSVYSVSACADSDIYAPAGRLLQALATSGIPVEDPAFLPLVMQRGAQGSTLGRLRSAGEAATGIGSVVAAVAKADPRITGGMAGLAVILGLTKRRQDERIEILLPLAERLIRLDAKIPLPDGICYAGLLLSGGDVPYAETEVRLAKPDAPIAVHAPVSHAMWDRKVDVEFTPSPVLAVPPAATR